MNVREYLQSKAVRTGQSILDVEETWEELIGRFSAEQLRLLGWGDMFMMDMMYFKRGGNYRMDEHARPREGDVVMIGGVEHFVYETSLFTFSAEAVRESESSEEHEFDAAVPDPAAA